VIAAAVNGSANLRLRPLTADASGLPVVAGPIAATALASGLPPAVHAHGIEGISRQSGGCSATPTQHRPTSQERR